MSRSPEQPHDAHPGGDDSLPPGLLADLSAQYPAPRVSASTDARVLNQAAATLARQARTRRWLRWGGTGAAAAAAAIVVAVALLPRDSQTVRLTGTQEAVTAATGDVDRSGRVDILDAFSLARRLRDGRGPAKPVTRSEDANGDGVVDQKDVDAIAHMAVRVGGGARNG